MTEQERKERLAHLEEQWKKEVRNCKKYRFLLRGAEQRKAEIEKAIREI